MFGIILAAKDIRTLIRTLRAERYLLASESLADMASALLKLMSLPPDGNRPFSDYVRHMIGPARTLATIQRQLGVGTHTNRQKGIGSDILRSPSVFGGNALTWYSTLRRMTMAAHCCAPPSPT